MATQLFQWIAEDGTTKRQYSSILDPAEAWLRAWSECRKDNGQHLQTVEEKHGQTIMRFSEAQDEYKEIRDFFFDLNIHSPKSKFLKLVPVWELK